VAGVSQSDSRLDGAALNPFSEVRYERIRSCPVVIADLAMRSFAARTVATNQKLPTHFRFFGLVRLFVLIRSLGRPAPDAPLSRQRGNRTSVWSERPFWNRR
jgi:hypothetical protein